jgi:hypothetical protein
VALRRRRPLRRHAESDHLWPEQQMERTCEAPCPGRSREMPTGYVDRKVGRRCGAREDCADVQGNKVTFVSIVPVPSWKT